MTTPHRTLQQALDALDRAISDDRAYIRECKDAAEAIRAHLAAQPAPAEDFCYCDDDISLQMVSGGAALEGLYGRVTLKINGQYVDYVKAQPLRAEPVALESVHLTRDIKGMCTVRVNGRVAIQDNGDIIDHMATLEWFAAPPTNHITMTDQLKIMPVEPCGAIGKCMASPSSYRDRLQYGAKTIAAAATLALRELEAARAKDIATHEKNLPAIENNRLIAAQITALNEAIGMPARWSERDQTSRSRYPKTISHPAGYITDITRECKTDDGFEHATLQYERMLKSYQEYAEQGKREAEQAQRAAERAREAEIAKRKADIELAAILLRYSLPLESTWADVLENLRGRHQRLDLAVAMSQTRCDWSDGAYRVRAAMDRFTIRDNEDKDIANDVLGCMDSFEDGRVFRDTRWSYDALFASVEDRQLVADVQRAMQLAGDD